MLNAINSFYTRPHSNNNGFNTDLAAVCPFKIWVLKDISSFKYITSQQSQAG
jgi:hypothetical protein